MSHCSSDGSVGAIKYQGKLNPAGWKSLGDLLTQIMGINIVGGFIVDLIDSISPALRHLHSFADRNPVEAISSIDREIRIIEGHTHGTVVCPFGCGENKCITKPTVVSRHSSGDGDFRGIMVETE